MPHNLPGEPVFRRAEVKLSSPVSMFRNVHQSQLLGSACGEASPHKVVTDRRTSHLPCRSRAFTIADIMPRPDIAATLSDPLWETLPHGLQQATGGIRTRDPPPARHAGR